MTTEELKQDLLDRYNDSWDEAHVIDNTGLIQAAKDNFKKQLETLLYLTHCQGLVDGQEER